MARTPERAASVLALLGLACAAPAPQRVIEPKVDEGEFVLSRKPPTGGLTHSGEFEIHLAERWLPFRASRLQVSEQEVAARDGSFAVQGPPGAFWDEQTAGEAVSIWSLLCNECHGGRRKKADALSMPSPKDGWGRGEGLFFGKRRPYREIYTVIVGGGPERNGKPSEMPAWKNKLSGEQIWSVIYFLEYQSGGIEGTFPPSLYPRGPESTE